MPSFITWIGREGGQKKSGSMNFCPNLFRQNLIVKKKERKKTTSSLWDHRHSGLVWDVILPFYLVVFQRKWLSSNFPHRKQNTQVWFRSTNVREESRKLILSYFMRTEKFRFSCFICWLDFSFPQFKKKSSALRRRHGNTKRLCKVLFFFKNFLFWVSPHYFFPNVPN